jgi:hypothetical protein
VKPLHPCRSPKHSATPTKPFSEGGENRRKSIPCYGGVDDQTTGAIMWTLISLFYRGYCRARLAEMRKFRLATTA